MIGTPGRTALPARLADDGYPVDRTGTGVVVEVYLAASLRCWELPHQGGDAAGDIGLAAACGCG